MDSKKLKPQIISAKSVHWQALLNQLKSAHPELTIVNHYHSQLNELFNIRYPKDVDNDKKRLLFISRITHKKPPSAHGNCIYSPWLNTLVHLLPKNEYQEVRTARNRPIISSKQQQQLMDLTVGVIGLSVGNAIIQNLVYSGGAQVVKVADADTLDLSNLNRIQASTTNLGINKAVIAAQHIYQINPYAKIVIYDQKINADNLKEFLISKPKLDVIIDECDDLTLKNYLR